MCITEYDEDRAFAEQKEESIEKGKSNNFGFPFYFLFDLPI